MSLSRPSLEKNRNPSGIYYSSEPLHMGTGSRVMKRITRECVLDLYVIFEN
jgi:hypothetical protein